MQNANGKSENRKLETPKRVSRPLVRIKTKDEHVRFPQTLSSRYMYESARGSCGTSIQRRTLKLFPGSSKTAAFQSPVLLGVFKIFMFYVFTVSG